MDCISDNNVIIMIIQGPEYPESPDFRKHIPHGEGSNHQTYAGTLGYCLLGICTKNSMVSD